MVEAVERVAGLILILIGLSHMLAPAAWRALFQAVLAKGEAAGLLNGAIHAPLGLLIVPLHPVWSGPGLVVTLIGWSLLAKAVLHLCWPALAQRVLKAAIARATETRFRISGALGLALGCYCAWLGWR